MLNYLKIQVNEMEWSNKMERYEEDFEDIETYEKFRQNPGKQFSGSTGGKKTKPTHHKTNKWKTAPKKDKWRD